ncbi:MAG: hypothetical protein ACI4E1_10835 [Lachnospira sp.]
MYTYIWNIIDKKNCGKRAKEKLFLFCTCALFALIGASIWFVAGQWVLRDFLWLLCFAGYPCVIIGFIGGIVFLWRKE